MTLKIMLTFLPLEVEYISIPLESSYLTCANEFSLVIQQFSGLSLHIVILFQRLIARKEPPNLNMFIYTVQLLVHDGTLSVRKKSKPSLCGRITQTMTCVKKKWYNYGATWKQMTLCWTELPKPESRNESLSLIDRQLSQLTPRSNTNSF